MKHFIKTEDFTKDDFNEVIRRTVLFRDNVEKGYGLAKGKVLATMFFKESTRTMSSFQAAMIRLGGGSTGISSSAGTYFASGEEDLEDFLKSFACCADIMVIRGNFDLEQFRNNINIPIINGLCAGHEHTFASILYAVIILNHLKKLTGLKIGLYGQNKNCRPYKTFAKFAAMYGAEIYEDSLVDELGLPKEIVDFINSNGGKYIKAPLKDFIKKVDFLCIADGLPSTTEDPKLMEEYNKKFNTVTLNDLKNLPKTSIFGYMMPRAMTDGRLTVAKEVDTDPRSITNETMNLMTPTAMAVITYLLNIKVD